MIIVKRTGGPVKPNPWAGIHHCPECATSTWTMPIDGRWEDDDWVCVNIRQHAYTVRFRP